ncbi:MAG TPA: replication-associated recombination protein A [Phycisphaerae bacterium]|nr:replication-associated recombination protein A [Phycisphaerae bacterium]HQL75789.1 replication-associated recombination protein A [Phycisphaerae bacterium]
MDLFRQSEDAAVAAHAPLAVRMRPRTVDEVVGQGHFLGEGKMLRRMLEADRLSSLVFHGPPGCGKTTLAQVVARHCSAEFFALNGASAGVKDVREIIERARAALASAGRRTVLFIDELHRFNRAQQDVLLDDVENGTVILIGATTENPFFTINSPLLSRSTLFRFEPLSEDDVVLLLRRAIADGDRGLGRYRIQASDDALAHLATVSDGDARRALTALEVGVLSQLRHASLDVEDPRQVDIVFDLAVAQESIQTKAVQYDRTGDLHYDAASALIKSMRGSDPDAAVYWLARMLEAGEDPRFIARRIAILASEDIGNADPRAISVAAATFDIVERVGMPECRITLAQAVIYMACAPKSNASYKAVDAALDDVRSNRTIPVPKHLRNAPHPGMAEQYGHGQGYQYSHDFAGGVSPDQDYLGVERTYYTPTDRGYEKHIQAYLAYVRKLRGEQ